MVSVSVKIDPKSFEDFQRAVEEFAKGLNTGTHDVAIRQAHLICMDAMTFTPPMLKSGGGGLEKNAERIGQNAIKGDIKSFAIGANKRSAAFLMYRKLGDAAFRNDQSYFYRVINNSQKAVKNITNPIMIKIAQDPNHERAFKKARNLFAKTAIESVDSGLYDRMYEDIRPMHEKYIKKFDGRAIRTKIGSGMTWINKHIATDQSVIDREIKRSNMNIGRLKAGWFKAKQQIPKMLGRIVQKPGGKVPAWVRKHGEPTGISNYRYNERTLFLSLINTIGNNNNVASTAGTKNIVYGNRVKQMPEELKHILEARAEKFNKKK